MAVLKSARGTGGGLQLVETMMEHVRLRQGKAGEWSRRNGVNEVRVMCISQVKAQGFYEKAGFEAEGEVHDEVRRA